LQRAVRQDPSRLSAWAALAHFSSLHQPLGLHRVARVAGGEALPHLLSRSGKYAGSSSLQLSEEVRTLCQRRVFEDAGNDGAWLALAWAQFSTACIADADDEWRLSASLLERFAALNVEAACALSECALHLREAKRALAAVASHKADSAAVLRARARVHLFDGMSREALRLYYSALQQPQLSSALRSQLLVEMSEVFLTGRDFAAAEHCLRLIPEPRDMNVTLRLVHLLVAARKEEEAKAVAATLPEVPRDHFAGNFVLGLLALRCGAMKAAERRLERAAAAEPRSPAVHELLSQCLMKRNVEEAKKELEKEIALNCGSEAAAMRSLWRLDKSKVTLQRCIRLDPSQAVLWKELQK
jgi:tetratricopeptide (TPR) repeat protein